MIVKIERLLFLKMLLLLSVYSYAQHTHEEKDSCKYKIEGTLYDLSTGEPLPFSTIQIKGTTKGTVADETGYFYLNSICEEEFDLVFSYVGYKPIIHHHDVHHRLPKIYLAPDDVTLRSIVIEGQKKPAEILTGTIKGISSKELTEHQHESLGEVLTEISGVSLLSTGQNVVKPVIHGLHSNRILIVNNGVRHEFQSWGKDHAPEIDPSSADNIQVIKGAATVRYGPDALGGVVLINPPAMELLSDLNGQVGITGISNGRAMHGNIRLQRGFHKIALSGQASYLYQGDLQTPDYLLSNSGKQEFGVTLGSRFHVKNMDLTAYYSHFQQKLGILRGSVTGNLDDLVLAMEADQPFGTTSFGYEINNPSQAVQHDMLKLNAHFLGEESIFNVQYAIQNNHRQEFDLRRGTNNSIPSINLRMVSHTLDVDWKHPEINGWFGTAGIQALYQDNDNIYGTNTIPFVPNFNNYRIGAFLIESKEFSNTTVEAGLRYDYQYSSVRNSQPHHRGELLYHNATATIGIIRKFENGSSFRSNLGSAWRPPSISELFSMGKHQASIDYGLLRYYFDESGRLKTDKILSDEEKGVDAEVGIKWINSYEIKTSGWDAELTGFINYIDNYFYTKPAGITNTVRGAFPFYIYDQTTALLAGADLSIIVEHTPEIQSELSGNYLWAKDITNDAYFIELPPLKIRYGIGYERNDWLGLSNAGIELNLSYSSAALYSPRVIPVREILEAKDTGEEIFSEEDKIFDIAAPPSGYILAKIQVAGEVKNWNFNFQIKNFLNQEYRSYTNRMRYFADEPGRSFVLSVKYSF